MISEEVTNKRAEAIVKLLDLLSNGVQERLKKDDAEGASKLSDSLTLLVIKTFEAENIDKLSDSASKMAKAAGDIKNDLKRLD